MKNLKALWQRFLHWQGWSDFAHWKGWKKLFLLPPLLVLSLCFLSAAGLIWVFGWDMGEHPLAYGIYVLSAYALTTLVLVLPGTLRRLMAALHTNPMTARLLEDDGLKFNVSLYFEQFLNFGYGIFKCIGAVLYASAWMGTEGFYNLVQGVIQLVQILRRRKDLTLKEQWKSYRLCGWLVLVMHLSTTGMAFLMIHDHIAEEYPGYMIFATAAFTFYKLIHSFIEVARDRKHKAPIDSSVRLLDLSQAMFSLFSLQVALLHAFGQDFPAAGLMNTLTGTAVSILMAGMGVYMLRRADREIKKL